MPPLDAPRAAAPPLTRPTHLAGWGGGDTVPALLLEPRAAEELSDTITGWRGAHPGTGLIARGMGRSYGDAAQLAGGGVIRTARLAEFTLEPHTGTVLAQAGVTLDRLLAALVPAGWMVPVVPGTQHVTVGGAIASDIHGKNHGVVGTFGAHVLALGLLTAAGELAELEPGDALFEATLGGMGLTGIIVWARIRLRPVRSALLSVDTDRVDDLDAALAALQVSGGPHRVAWLDLLGRGLARGVVTRADHVDPAVTDAGAAGRGASATVAPRATVPANFPDRVLRPEAVQVFNALRFRRAPRAARGHFEGLGRHMFPLDSLVAWPRLYGRRGFLQYQLVVPFAAEVVLRRVLERLRAARIPCYLAVLKDFGPANAAPLSFPIAGWTLALDIPRGAPNLEAALRGCDELVAGCGGRVYLTKDSRLRPDAVRAMYPRFGEWRATRDDADPDGLWCSDLARRAGLLDGAAG